MRVAEATALMNSLLGFKPVALNSTKLFAYTLTGKTPVLALLRLFRAFGQKIIYI